MTKSPHQLPTETDTLVVGAGPQALTLLARWMHDQPARIDHIVVVDPSGSWMRAWDRRFDRQRIDALRSPGVHHPDPDEMAFINAHAPCGADGARPPAKPDDDVMGPLRRPATTAFTRFCRDLTRRAGLTHRVTPATVVDLAPARAAGASPIRWSALLSDGTTVRARQVVWAGNPHRPRTPCGVELGEVVLHSDAVDLDSATPGRRIAVLGGGQTAGQLAREAARRGADVALISRGPQRVADLDVDAGWLMADHLVPFRSITDPAERRQAVERARRGSMTPELVDALDRTAVRRLSDAGELTARPCADGAIVGFAGVELEVDLVWVATGSLPDLRADPALAGIAATGGPHVDGWPILDEHLQWRDGLYIVGALAALTLGPAAGNLGGARAAAELLSAHAPPARHPRCTRSGETRNHSHKLAR